MAGPWTAIGQAVGGAAVGGIKSLASGNNVSESRTVYDPMADIFSKGIDSQYWRADTKWYNDNIVSSAYARARNSLEDAGYNPLMALQNGGLYDSAPMASGMATKSSAKDISSNKSIDMLTNAETANTWADTDLKSAQAVTEGFKQDNLAIETEIGKIDKELRKGDLKYQEREKLTNMKYQLETAHASLINAYANGITAKSNQKLNSAKEMEARANAQYTLNKPIQTQKHGGGAKVYLGPASAGWDVYDRW